MPHRIALAQLHQSSAANGDVATFDTASGQWKAVPPSGSGTASNLQQTYTAASSLALGDAVYISAADTVDLASAASDSAASRFLGTASAAISATATGTILTEGVVSARFEASLSLTAGDEVYLSAATPGRFTNVAPSAAGNIELLVGYIKNVSTYDGASLFNANVHLIRGSRSEIAP